MLFIKQGYVKSWLFYCCFHLMSSATYKINPTGTAVTFKMLRVWYPTPEYFKLQKKVLILRFVIFDMISVKNREAKEVAWMRRCLTARVSYFLFVLQKRSSFIWCTYYSLQATVFSVNVRTNHTFNVCSIQTNTIQTFNLTCWFWRLFGLSGHLTQYLTSVSPNSALVQNYSHYKPVSLLGCVISVSAANKTVRGKAFCFCPSRNLLYFIHSYWKMFLFR